MAFREVPVFEIKEVLRLRLGGEGLRSIARLTGVDRKTVRRYVEAAVASGMREDGDVEQLDDGLIGLVCGLVRPARPGGHGAAWVALVPHEEQIRKWVKQDLRLTKILELLDVDLPWTRMRQVYRLLGLARRFGDHRVEAACAQALALDVVDVSVITRLLERGREHTQLPSPPVASQLPLRFTRHQIALDGPNCPHRDTGPPSLRPSEAIVEAAFATDPDGGDR